MSDETVSGVVAPVAPEPAAPVEPVYYVGSSSVSSMETLPDGMIRVVLHDPSGVPPVLDFTPEQYEAVKSLEPYEDVQISIKKWRMGIAQMIKVLLDNHMQMGDMSFVLTRLRDGIQNNYNNAVGKKFGVKDQDYISLQQIDEVLKSN